MNAAGLFVLIVSGLAVSAAAAMLALLLGLSAVALLLLLAGAIIRMVRRRARNRQLAQIRTARHRRPRQIIIDPDPAVELEQVAQAIAYCYGHGPIRVMDPAHRREFERDARAAIKAMRKDGR